MSTSSLLLTLDLVGITAFALSGALVAVRKSLDVFGVLVLACTTGLGGGVLRDVLIGDVPPAALDDWRYIVTPVVAGLVAFRLPRVVGRLERSVALWDAAGMGLFCAAGALKAAEFGLDPLPAALLGMTTAIGGGVLRDLLAGRVPVVLRAELYAIPALAGAIVAVVLDDLGASPLLSTVAAVVVATGWRVVAIQRDWHAPRAGVDV